MARISALVRDQISQVTATRTSGSLAPCCLGPVASGCGISSLRSRKRFTKVSFSNYLSENFVARRLEKNLLADNTVCDLLSWKKYSFTFKSPPSLSGCITWSCNDARKNTSWEVEINCDKPHSHNKRSSLHSNKAFANFQRKLFPNLFMSGTPSLNKKLENWPPFDYTVGPTVIRWIETAGPTTMCFTQNKPCKWFGWTPQKHQKLPIDDVLIVKISKPSEDHCI